MNISADFGITVTDTLRRKGDEFAFSEFAAAGGGIAKLAGVSSGPPPGITNG